MNAMDKQALTIFRVAAHKIFKNIVTEQKCYLLTYYYIS